MAQTKIRNEQVDMNLDFCEARTNATTTVPNGTSVVIPLGVTTTDTNNMHNPNTNSSRITIKQKGRYLVNAQISFGSVVANRRYSCLLYKDGSEYRLQRTHTAETGLTVIQGSWVIELDEDDYIELATWHNAGVNQTVENVRTMLQVTQIAHLD